MSLESSAWAWKQRIKRNSRTSRPAVKVVLIALANLVDQHNMCTPSITRLQRDTELSRQTILSALQYLQQIDLIRETGTGASKNKTFCLFGMTDPA